MAETGLEADQRWVEERQRDTCPVCKAPVEIVGPAFAIRNRDRTVSFVPPARCKGMGRHRFVVLPPEEA